MNPHAHSMMQTYHSYKALFGMDENFADYIAFAESVPAEVQQVAQNPTRVKEKAEYASELQRAVVKGLKEQAAALTEAMLRDRKPLDIVENEIIPALNAVGEGFENKTVYLPGLLMSAEAAKFAFESVKAAMSGAPATKGPVIIATVKGDIHDIGKNIVKLLLENFGFAVIDLGKDCEPESVAAEALRVGARLVALSALMTTTVPAMEETVKLLRARAPECKVMVGGAVLNEEYTAMIGADKYAKDAMEAVRYADSVI